MRTRSLLALVAAALWPVAAAGQAPRFEVPIDCAVGRDCFVQNYVDQDASAGYADFACGSLSYDGHDGTDIRLTNLVAMTRGVAVLAAADGTVLRTRDGMDDVSVAEIGAEAVEGREAGNGVIIDHGDGWETQYGHLRKGSVRVAPGQRVAAGEPIGLVGLSGGTEFPHVEFVVRHGGEEVDPFIGLAPGSGCGVGDAPLWSAAAMSRLAYRAGGLLSAGFATEAPDGDRARAAAG
ncbi:MAG: M23 family metallopeptidase, partial [Alphaproteobacteria bacterium]